MRIALITINYSPELTGISVYSTGLAEYLASVGHQVTVYTAFAYYPAWKKSEADRGRIFRSEKKKGVDIRRNYIYVPRRPTALRRMLHEFSFACSAAIRFVFGPPCDVTVIVSPPLLLGILFGVLARLKRSKSILHVQDLQPDAAIDLGMLKPGLLTSCLFLIERWGYSLATQVSTISEAMRRRIESKGVPRSKTLLLKNWANDELIQPLHPKQSLRGAFELRDEFVVLYSGNMGVKQGLGMLLDAAIELRGIPEVLFLMVGDGGEKEALVARARREGLTNVRFAPPVPQDQLNRLLATADVSVIAQRAGIDDLVLPSKLGNLLASLRPLIVSAAVGSELALIIEQSNSGIVVPPGDGAGLAKAVCVLKSSPDQRNRMASNGQTFAQANLGSKVILERFERELKEIAASN